MKYSPLSTREEVGEGLNDRLAPIPASPKMVELGGDFLTELGEDPQRPGLLRTPERVAKAWNFLTQGYHTDLNELVNGAIFEEKYDEIVAVKNIHFCSMCEHHLLPFFGVCSVAYIPNGQVIGLSKIPRIVDMFARRLQLQERLTQQIAETLDEVLHPQGVAVVMEAYHLCMIMRGVEKQDSRTTTSEMLGSFKKNPQTRQEFLNLMAMRLT
jgi:GTP cyclohydrolase IA